MTTRLPQYLLLANADAGTWEVLRRDEGGDVVVGVYRRHAWARRRCDRLNAPAPIPASPKSAEFPLTQAEQALLDQRALEFAARHAHDLGPVWRELEPAPPGTVSAAMRAVLTEVDHWPSRKEEMTRRRLLRQWTAIEQRLRMRVASHPEKAP